MSGTKRSSASLPSALTPFIGRQVETNEILDLIGRPECRLLTLLGSGGVGKTRLALHVAHLLSDSGIDVVYVDLQPVHDSQLVAMTIADVLGLKQEDSDAQRVQLIEALRRRRLVLVLDNFEQLLDARDLLDEILREAPDTKLIITSRVVLQLHGEWQYPVGGLHYLNTRRREELCDVAPEQIDAVRLFTACAQRVRPAFQLETEVDGVIALCEVVEGMPLALELAATWVRSMPPLAIAGEIRRDLDFLSVSMQNMPERHRSMQAVFERSYGFLNEKEREVFRRLAVFRGGFTADAARTIADATAEVLAALVDSSLLRWSSKDRFDIHELLRQFAENRLRDSPDELEAARRRHGRYYVGLIGSNLEALSTQRRAAMKRMYDELDNIRAGWQSVIEFADLAVLQRGGFAFFAFCQGQSLYREGVEMLTSAYDALTTELAASEDRERTRAELLAGRGWLALRLGRLDEAVEVLRLASEIYTSANLTPAPIMGTDPLPPLSVLAAIAGDYDDAHDIALRAWATAESRSDLANLALAGYALTGADMARGEYSDALVHANRTLVLAEEVENRWFTAYVHNQIGEIRLILGDTAGAKASYEASYATREEFEDPEGMAVALYHLGEIALARNEAQEAKGLYERSISLYEQVGDLGGLVRAHSGLGMAAHVLDEETLARRSLYNALEMSKRSDIIPLLLKVFADVGAFLLDHGVTEPAVGALAMARSHSASQHMVRQRADRILRNLGIDPQPALPDELESVVIELLSVLEHPVHSSVSASDASGSRVQRSGTPTVQPRLEPLSARQQEVLALVGRGLTNREIANQLTITLGTVKAHINHIYGKLGVRNRVEAVARAKAVGLL